MRFSTVAALSAAALASSASAYPVSVADYDLAARYDDELDLRSLSYDGDELFARAPTAGTPTTQPSTHATSAPGANNHKTTTSNGKHGMQKADQDLATSRTDYQKYQKELKLAQADLAGARKFKATALNDACINFRSTEDFLESLLARDFFDADDALFARAPSQTTSSTTPSPSPNTNAGTAKPAAPKANSNPNTSKPKGKRPLTYMEKASTDLSTSRTDYQKAEKEFAIAQADLANARKFRTQAMDDMGLQNLGKGLGAGAPPSAGKAPVPQQQKRDLDVDEIMEIIARDYDYGYSW